MIRTRTREELHMHLAQLTDVASAAAAVLFDRGWARWRPDGASVELWRLPLNPETQDGLVLADALRYEFM